MRNAIDTSRRDAGQPWLEAGGEAFRSRLLVGIEQYESASLVGQVLDASGSDVFITTMDPSNQRSSLLLSDVVEELPARDFRWIGTTSFARSAADALTTARMLRDSHGINVMKLDVRSAGNWPDNAATIQVAETLCAEGMDVLPFILPSVADARTLESLGCAALRVMAAPVGSGRGIPQPWLLREVIDQTALPVVVEGGLGTARHATLAMELGAAAVLVNTALVQAADPVLLAESMKYAVRAGLLANWSRPMGGDPALDE